MWEEGAWENRLWMQIWSLYSPVHGGLSLAQPQPCQKGQFFEGFGVRPASDALRAVLRPSSAASSARLLGSYRPSFPQAASNHGPPWSLHTRQPYSPVPTHPASKRPKHHKPPPWCQLSPTQGAITCPGHSQSFLCACRSAGTGLLGRGGLEPVSILQWPAPSATTQA